MEDLYKILEVDRSASQDDIKKAYHKLVKLYHPDLHPGDKDNEEKFKKINAAYTVLSDPEKRARYDQFGTTNPNADPFSGMGGFGGVDFGDFFDLFSGGFGGFHSRQSYNPNAARRGNNIEMLVRVSLLEAFTGIKRNIDVMKSETCPKCNGSGAKPGTKPETCKKCNGRGQVQQTQRSFLGSFTTITTCPDCHGTGKIIRDKCDECGGSGRVRRKKTLEVKIPAGVERNMRLRIPDAGEAGINGGEAGDLYLIIDVELDPKFERQGADLHTSLVLTYPQAVLGTEATIKTLDGKDAKISVPAGTNHGQVLKIKGKGMPKINTQNFGDLYAHVFIDVPSKLTDKQRELIKSLADEMQTPVGNGEKGFFDKFKDLFK
ncbi:MAG: molecular chaperone DnaJ [Synergistaceae bacterium]|nr:molecular chaperone DnaJ [Synergistaceae bacterium]